MATSTRDSLREIRNPSEEGFLRFTSVVGHITNWKMLVELRGFEPLTF
jgi:hypothetical protein